MAALGWNKIKTELNWESIRTAIIADDAEILTEQRLRDALNAVQDAAEYYVPYDLQCLTINAVEQTTVTLFDIPETRNTDTSVLDLVVTVKLGAPKPYTLFAGKTAVIDWKTTGSALDTAWRQRYIESWQWKRYAHIAKCELFEYRGVSTKKNFNGQRLIHECKPIILKVPDNNSVDFLNHQKGIVTIKNALQPLEVYPRNAPDACFKYGETCSYCSDCENYTMPQRKIADRSYSYSSDTTLLLCPEKFRRETLNRDDGKPRVENVESASYFGTLCHRGFAELYLQIKKKQEEGLF